MATTKPDNRHDGRLTVICATPSKNGFNTIIEAWGTDAEIVKPMRFRFTVAGVHDVEFGWLISFDDARMVRLYVHEDAPGFTVRLKSKVAQLPALT